MRMSRLAIVCLLTLVAPPAFAQPPDGSSFVPDVVKRVVLDPTTYAPAIVAWIATRLDWKSSQIFFRNGFVEENPRFTISGRRADTAISYAAGNRRIVGDAVTDLQFSVINNAAGQVIERILRQRYPDHPRLVRAIGWIERSSMASYWSYRLAEGHFRQWQDNERGIRQLGL
jgi:hypothetical protein